MHESRTGSRSGSLTIPIACGGAATRLRPTGFIRTGRTPALAQSSSTLLHFCDSRPYPILDFRALWSLGYSKPPHYTMLFWLEYLEFTRLLAARLAVPIRTIDRALWQYSKTKQR